MFRRKAESAVGGAVLLAIFGGLAWYNYPGEHLFQKPLASRTLQDLGEILLPLWLAAIGLIGFITALRQADDD